MNILVVGASGATGSLVVNLLLQEKYSVTAVVRENSEFLNVLPNKIANEHTSDFSKYLHIIKGNVLEMDVTQIKELVENCHAIVCCLGHNIHFKGIWGKPRKLVADTTRLLCEACNNIQSTQPIKFVLMNSVGNANRDLKEKRSFADRLVIGLVRCLVPPQSDNEDAADYLRIKVGQNNPKIEWVAVRPDALINEKEVSAYTCHHSPTSTVIFGTRNTSRINVASFMKDLLKDKNLWNTWKGAMPVIYNDINDNS